MLAGMLITNGLSGLKDKFCSNIKLKRNVKKEGAYSVFEISIVVGVMKITRNTKKRSKKCLLFIVAITEQVKIELNR